MNPYEILGVDKTADAKTIKQAYRKLAHQHHPDRNQGNKESEQKFKEVSAAYEILSDPKKRQQYDQFGSTGGQGGFGGAQGFDFSQFSQGEAFSDIFENFFGGGSRQSKPKSFRGGDIEVGVAIDFKDAIFGTTEKIRYRKQVRCGACKGSGAAHGVKVVSCTKCSGSGQVREARRTFLGQVMTTRTCDFCHGRGQVPEKKCIDCNGVSVKSQTVEVSIKVPAGIHNGATMRLGGKGNDGQYNNESGDLYVMVKVRKHARFIRDGNDIYTTETIHVLQAVLGDMIEVETVHGKKRLKIKAGTTENKVYRLKEEGVPHLQSENIGDHYCKIKIDIPKKVSAKEKKLYLELAKEAELDISPQKGGIFT